MRRYESEHMRKPHAHGLLLFLSKCTAQTHADTKDQLSLRMKSTPQNKASSHEEAKVKRTPTEKNQEDVPSNLM